MTSILPDDGQEIIEEVELHIDLAHLAHNDPFLLTIPCLNGRIVDPKKCVDDLSEYLSNQKLRSYTISVINDRHLLIRAGIVAEDAQRELRRIVEKYIQ